MAYKIAYEAFIKHYPFQLENLRGEIWKDILNYEGLYKISNFGRVKSFWFGREKILTPAVNRKGYLHVGLCKDGKQRNFRIHRLVAEAFIPNPKKLPQVDHIDTNKFNCRADNLRWVTNAENQQYAVESGASKSGEEHCKAKLTNEQVRLIRENPDSLTIVELAKRFGVSKATIGQIQLGRTYKNAGGSVRKAQKRNRLPDTLKEEIRRLYKPYSRESGTVALAKRFNVGRATVWYIVHEGEGGG